jgi:2-oxo-4-hydroxy-4-carboxy--5-ureidoimidazoline (OHCU) decarboxylase
VRNRASAMAIVEEIERRSHGDAGAELDACIREVLEIARLRLEDAVAD